MDESTCAYCFQSGANFRCPICDDAVYCDETCCEADSQNHNPGPTGYCAEMSVPCFQCFQYMRPLNTDACHICLQTCHVCKRRSIARCGKCRSVHYCSNACQLADWPAHKSLCKSITKGGPLEAGRGPPMDYIYPTDTGDVSSAANYQAKN